jgi:hypothetical protein
MYLKSIWNSCIRPPMNIQNRQNRQLRPLRPLEQFEPIRRIIPVRYDHPLVQFGIYITHLQKNSANSAYSITDTFSAYNGNVVHLHD